jgi:hypothetical protein
LSIVPVGFDPKFLEQTFGEFHISCFYKSLGIFKFVLLLRNGHSRANLANSSTCQNGHFRKYARLTGLADIRQTIYRGLARLADIRQTVYQGLARLAEIRQAIYRVLARLAKGEFGECYANLANLANVG